MERNPSRKQYFYETLVRIHRRRKERHTPASNRPAVISGRRFRLPTRLWKAVPCRSFLSVLTAALDEGVRDRFKEVIARGQFSSDDVEAGRRYVKAYVEFLNYVETVYETAGNRGEALHPEP